MTAGRLRLMKVRVQPVFVVDDGEHLTELVADQVEVSAHEWPAWAGAPFQQAVHDLAARLDLDV